MAIFLILVGLGSLCFLLWLQVGNYKLLKDLENDRKKYERKA